ncbi:MAG: hypothetical protein FJ271_16225 [Planctomycetes bacterium]|nr:hypothetical protein [Planctomycetota bacterium]
MNIVSPRFFGVTNPGLSATRWLAHVLGAHPDVYVAHGKHALDSVQREDFEKAKETAGIDSLVRGNDMAGFYAASTLEEVLTRYQEEKPAARAFGFVHSYTVHTLIRAARHAETLENICIQNLVRHPITYISSHYSLVRQAERYPKLYAHYVGCVFPEAVKEYPELILLECPDYRAFVAFVVSCFGVANLIRDLAYPRIRSVRMEKLTSDLDALRNFCEELTGLPYSADMISGFIRQGAINLHRTDKERKGPNDLYQGWEVWQRDIAHVMIPSTVIDWLENMDYDLSMLRGKSNDGRRSGTLAPCLGDQLRALDAKHPLLAYLDPTEASDLRFIDEELQGFNLVHQHGQAHAVARSVDVHDLSMLEPGRLRELQDRGLCLTGDSVADVWVAISRSLSVRPELIQSNLRGYDLVAFRGKIFARSRAFEIADIDRIAVQHFPELERREKLYVSDSLADARAWVERITYRLRPKRILARLLR